MKKGIKTENYGAQKTPVAHEISLNVLTLPVYEELALEDVDKICEIIQRES